MSVAKAKEPEWMQGWSEEKKILWDLLNDKDIRERLAGALETEVRWGRPARYGARTMLLRHLRSALAEKLPGDDA